MGSLRAQPVPGWTVSLTTLDLEAPIVVHGQEISSYVSVVEFRAEDGGGIGPGEFQEFALSGGPFPDAEQIAYPTVQSYSDGSESAWIEPAVDGQEEPERPAPVLTLSGSAGGHDAPSTEEAAATGPAEEDGSAGDVALYLSIAALVLALGGVVLGWRAYRRTVSA